LREDKRYVAAVIKMFSPEYDVKAIAARRTYKANPWFKRGTLFRSALDAMRVANRPLTVRQIVERVLAAKGIATPRIDQVRGLQSAVLASLRHREGRGSIRTVGEGSPARWLLASIQPHLVLVRHWAAEVLNIARRNSTVVKGRSNAFLNESTNDFGFCTAVCAFPYQIVQIGMIHPMQTKIGPWIARRCPTVVPHVGDTNR
jgi:hypothetical protein